MPPMPVLKMLFRFRGLIALYVAAEFLFKVGRFAMKRRSRRMR